MNVSLPILSESSIRSTAKPKHLFFAFSVHGIRLLLLSLMVFGLHLSANAKRLSKSSSRAPMVDLSQVSLWWPTAKALRAYPSEPELIEVLDDQGQPIGYVAQTSPIADHIIGYAGPSNLLIGIALDRSIQKVAVAKSADTHEHVLRVERDEAFWKQFVGLSWGQENTSSWDGVSGATLTSLAFAESIATRVQSSARSIHGIAALPRRSLKFPQGFSQNELENWMTRLQDKYPSLPLENAAWAEHSSWESIATNSDGRVVLRAIRTGPLADGVLGYQGPTEIQMLLDADGTILAAEIRHTFDNQPYVRYVAMERSFWDLWIGKKWNKAEIETKKADEIDGVSGATMTSQAIAETIQIASQERYQLLEAQAKSLVESSSLQSSNMLQRPLRWNWTWSEWTTLVIAGLSLVWSQSHQRGNPKLRLAWQMISLLAIGLYSSNLLSLALFHGWTRGGVSFRLAPGLTTLLIVSLLSCALFRRNVYCDHVCPHGILQQWIRGFPRQFRWKLPRFLETVLFISARLSFLLAVGCLTFNLTFPFAWLEPFNTYAWRVGLSWSGLVWFVSLLLSSASPMVYCRKGCSTGMILDFVKLDRSRWKWKVVDWSLVAAVCLIWLHYWISPGPHGLF